MIQLTHGERRRLEKGVARRVYEFTDDKKEAAWLFKELYREIKDRFGVPTYKDVKSKDLQSVIQLIENWSPLS
ncbi:ORF6C domain-containing protein [Peribacillus frigoritolerans]|uniref:ORF6C domain-containing protein n=1 Tax=Peribacillus frigoritolerans TaxID=450367 RepID=UPI0022816FB9|nr:ORF6C domain-containing protein [Peribacillus frigoritolerans]MCY9140553.1 ORF6C domain-containing protein [Peribacillus frigoritolerans]